jgi:uncharacterized phage-associated protein
MFMAYQPIPVANEFIARFGQVGEIDHMKLQKLLYFTNGWYLGLAGQSLLIENPQVWRYGPVFRWVYNAFSRFGKGYILAPLAGNPFGDGKPDRLNEAALGNVGNLIEWVWGEYGGKTGVQLSDETHAPGTPWQRIAAAHSYTVKPGTEISPREDWEYFAKLVEARGWKAAEFVG